ncbi:MAG TPA: hypothetical protein VGG42_09190 [Acidobacteriaceae bacterium]|jgi:hypothetical protein
MRRRVLLTVLLLAVCGMAAAQSPAAATPAPVAQQPAAAHPAAADANDASVSAVPAAALSPQQQRLLDQADQLVALAQQLRAEVNKTTQYTLSLNTLRRADDIEKLAKTLQKHIEQQDR